MKLLGSPVVTMTPPTKPPRPSPTFAATRCCANAIARTSGRVTAASSADCPVSHVPTPAPVRNAAGKACHASWMNG